MSNRTQHVTRIARRLAVSVVALTAALWCGGATPAAAQDLIDLYRAERMNERIRVAREQPEPLAPRTPEHVAPPADSLRLWLRRQGGWRAPEPLPPLVVEKWHAVPRLAGGWFEKAYGQRGWSFSGASRLTPLDTSFSSELRARLQDRFGPPTRTTGDFSPEGFRQADAPAQFEYWLVVNDSIPMKVTDVNGPFERGVVVASARRYHRRLGELRDALETELAERAEPAPFVDYYYLTANGAWFRTGYDGQRFLLEAIEPPNLGLGRAWLDALNTTRD